ncbi:MAG TPA: peroxidase family protein [Candidatus Acidoferrum sp.]|jgi:hypothetical protein|nr:peroxidase family protein [Candidatus Acidoferrum sp.]
MNSRRFLQSAAALAVYVLLVNEVSHAQTTGRYGHMFPIVAKPDANDLRKLTELGRCMLDKDSAPLCNVPHDVGLAIYTYFGQLIDHDLSFDGTPLKDAGKWEAEDTHNRRTPWLDLDQVYGGGPGRSRALYTGPKDAERFKIEPNCDLPLGRPYKLLGDQLLPVKRRDFRDLENAILLQVHVLFMRLHNIAVEQGLSCGIPEVDAKDKTPFNKAARVVRWQYQWLVRNDFLDEIIEKNIKDAVLEGGPKYQWKAGKFFIPVEFSAAAFRFGHSAVRPNYTLRQNGEEIGLAKLIDPEIATKSLPQQLVIEWERFLLNRMRSIDARVVLELGNLQNYTVRIFTNDPLTDMSKRGVRADPPELPARTLIRSAQMRVASGQTIACVLRLPEDQRLSPEELTGRMSCEDAGPDKAGQALLHARLLEDTPLFYYILREAEARHYGRRLGPVGSQIIADVIEGSFRADRDSYWGVSAKWKPPLWNTASGPVAIEHLSDLVKVVGDCREKQ